MGWISRLDPKRDPNHPTRCAEVSVNFPRAFSHAIGSAGKILLVEALDMVEAAVCLLEHKKGNQTNMVSMDLEGYMPDDGMVIEYKKAMEKGLRKDQLGFWFPGASQLLPHNYMIGNNIQNRVRTIQVGSPRGIVVIFDVTCFDGGVPKRLYDFLKGDVVKLMWGSSNDVTMWDFTFPGQPFPSRNNIDLQTMMTPKRQSKLGLKPMMEMYLGAPRADATPYGPQLLRPLRKKRVYGGWEDNERYFRKFLKYGSQDVILHAVLVAWTLRFMENPIEPGNDSQAWDLMKLKLANKVPAQSLQLGEPCSTTADLQYKKRIQSYMREAHELWLARGNNARMLGSGCLFNVNGMDLLALTSRDINDIGVLFDVGRTLMDQVTWRTDVIMKNAHPRLNRNKFPMELIQMATWEQRNPAPEGPRPQKGRVVPKRPMPKGMGTYRDEFGDEYYMADDNELLLPGEMVDPSGKVAQHPEDEKYGGSVAGPSMPKTMKTTETQKGSDSTPAITSKAGTSKAQKGLVFKQPTVVEAREEPRAVATGTSGESTAAQEAQKGSASKQLTSTEARKDVGAKVTGTSAGATATQEAQKGSTVQGPGSKRTEERGKQRVDKKLETQEQLRQEWEKDVPTASKSIGRGSIVIHCPKLGVDVRPERQFWKEDITRYLVEQRELGIARSMAAAQEKVKAKEQALQVPLRILLGDEAPEGHVTPPVGGTEATGAGNRSNLPSPAVEMDEVAAAAAVVQDMEVEQLVESAEKGEGEVRESTPMKKQSPVEQLRAYQGLAKAMGELGSPALAQEAERKRTEVRDKLQAKITGILGEPSQQRQAPQQQQGPSTSRQAHPMSEEELAQSKQRRQEAVYRYELGQQVSNLAKNTPAALRHPYPSLDNLTEVTENVERELNALKTQRLPKLSAEDALKPERVLAVYRETLESVAETRRRLEFATKAWIKELGVAKAANTMANLEASNTKAALHEEIGGWRSTLEAERRQRQLEKREWDETMRNSTELFAQRLMEAERRAAKVAHTKPETSTKGQEGVSSNSEAALYGYMAKKGAPAEPITEEMLAELAHKHVVSIMKRAIQSAKIRAEAEQKDERIEREEAAKQGGGVLVNLGELIERHSRKMVDRRSQSVIVRKGNEVAQQVSLPVQARKKIEAPGPSAQELARALAAEVRKIPEDEQMEFVDALTGSDFEEPPTQKGGVFDRLGKQNEKEGRGRGESKEVRRDLAGPAASSRDRQRDSRDRTSGTGGRDSRPDTSSKRKRSPTRSRDSSRRGRETSRDRDRYRRDTSPKPSTSQSRGAGRGAKERRRDSRSQERRRSSRSQERRRSSKSPERRRSSKSPERRRSSKSPERRRSSKSPERRQDRKAGEQQGERPSRPQMKSVVVKSSDESSNRVPVGKGIGRGRGTSGTARSQEDRPGVEGSGAIQAPQRAQMLEVAGEEVENFQIQVVEQREVPQPEIEEETLELETGEIVTEEEGRSAEEPQKGLARVAQEDDQQRPAEQPLQVGQPQQRAQEGRQSRERERRVYEIPCMNQGMILGIRRVNRALSPRRQFDQRAVAHRWQQVQKVRKADQIARQMGVPPTFVWEFYNGEWMFNWHPRGMQLRLHRRYFKTMDALGFEEEDVVDPAINDKITELAKGFAAGLKEAAKNAGVTKEMFIQELAGVERAFRAFYTGNIPVSYEAEYDWCINALARKLRLMLRGTAIKGDMWWLAMPKEAAIPLLLRVSGKGAIKAGRSAVRQRLMGDHNYWREREWMMGMIESWPIHTFNDRTGWENEEFMQSFNVRVDRLGEITNTALEGIKTLWETIEREDAYAEDGQVDSGGYTDVEGPEEPWDDDDNE